MRIIFIILSTTLLCGCQKNSTPPARWEYHIEEVENHAIDQSRDQVSKTPIDYSTMIFLDKDVGTFDSIKNSDKFSALGREGWELATATPLLKTSYPAVDGHPFTRTEKVVFVFKRPLK